MARLLVVEGERGEWQRRVRFACEVLQGLEFALAVRRHHAGRRTDALAAQLAYELRPDAVGEVVVDEDDVGPSSAGELDRLRRRRRLAGKAELGALEA